MKARIMQVEVYPEELEKLCSRNEKLVIDIVITHANVKITTKQKINLQKQVLNINN